MYINDTCKMNTSYFAFEYVLLPKACFNRCQLYGLNATNVGGWRAKSLSSTPRRGRST